MSYEYNPREASEALPHDISAFGEVIEEKSKAFINTVTQLAEQVNMKPVSEATEAAVAAMQDTVKLFQSMLGDQNDGPRTGTLHGLKKLADEQAALMN